MANLLLRGTFRQIATSHDNNVPALNTSREQFVWVNKKKYGLRRLYHPRNVQTTQQQQQKRIAQVNVFFFLCGLFFFPIPTRIDPHPIKIKIKKFCWAPFPSNICGHQSNHRGLLFFSLLQPNDNPMFVSWQFSILVWKDQRDFSTIPFGDYNKRWPSPCRPLTIFSFYF
jgi:hypothetical protein